VGSTTVANRAFIWAVLFVVTATCLVASLQTSGSIAKEQPVKDDGKTKGFSGLAKEILQVETDEGVGAGGGVTVSDPNCQIGTIGQPGYKPKTPGAQCTTLSATIPVGSQYVGAQVFAKNLDATNWSSCPIHFAGFMDCARYIGWVRFLGNVPTIVTTSSGTTVSWQMINWATYARQGKLVVLYTQP
jgi:hypothetical protein